MIKYACPRCFEALQAPNERLGAIHPCPKCGGQVQVPLAKSSNVVLIVLSTIGVGIVGFSIMMMMMIIVCLAAIQIIGSNSNKAFGTVGSSIGSIK